MKEKVAIINMEESIGKTVGRRSAADSMAMAHSTKQRALEWQKSFPVKMPLRGVFRFHSHEEADLWWTKVTIQQTAH